MTKWVAQQNNFCDYNNINQNKQINVSHIKIGNTVL